MILRLSAKVDSVSAVPWPVTVMCRDYNISVFPGPDLLIERIQVNTRWTPSDEELPTFRLTPEAHAKAEIHVPGSATENELFALLHYIESVGGFWLGIREIEWEVAETEWLPEGPDEAQRLGLRSSRITTDFPDPPRVFRPALLRQLVENRQKHEPMVIPLGFLREGNNDYRLHRFSQAFRQFYFYLEALYANGQFRTRAVQEEFKSSEHLREAAMSALRSFQGDNPPKGWPELNRELERRGYRAHPEDILDFLVDVRGELNHFTLRRADRHPHAFNQRTFQHVAYLILHICHSTYPLILRDGEPK